MYVIDIDALYLRPMETGVGYALEDYRVKNPSFEDRFGVRVYFKKKFASENALTLGGFHYHARVHDQIDAGAIPLWGHPGLIPTGSLTDGDHLWRLHMGLIDFGLSHLWHPSTCFSIEFLATVQYAEIRHKLTIEYQFSDQQVDFSMKNKYWGVGPGGGFIGHFWWTYWFSLFAKGTFTASFGKFYIHQDQHQSDGKLKVKNDFSNLAPNLHFILGGEAIWGGNTAFFARIGLETYLFFGQNQLLRFSDQAMLGKGVVNQGDLSLWGPSFSLGVCF